MRFVLLLLIGVAGLSTANAHPWGGLVIDADGHVYFTFICPLVDDDHYACVWQLGDGTEPTAVLESQRSPSDIVLARSPGRTIYGAERTGSGHHQSRLWQRASSDWETVVAPTTDPAQFHIQAYAVADDGTLFFARDAQLFKRDTAGTVTPVPLNAPFERIDALAWGPDDALYLLNQGTLHIVASDGTVRTLATGLKEEDPEHLPFSGANILFDLAVDDAGNAYLAYYGNRRVLKVSATGEVSTFLQAATPWSPHGVDVYNGRVYVLESTVGGGTWWKIWERPVIAPRVRAVHPDGRVTTVFEHRPPVD